jgi:ribosome-associated protein
VALRWTKELLDLGKECEVTPYKSSGPGGQKKNKTESSVRVVHLPTGLTRIATESRSQSANRLHALERIRQALEALRHKPRPRRATKPTGASRAKRMGEKVRRSQVKRLRQRPDED